MKEFFAKTQINAPADEVFAFVTDFTRMPQYLPTLHKATPVGENKVRIQGESAGHSYDVEGWFQTHLNERTMLWGSDGANHYSGDLEVMSQGESCILAVTLKFEASAGMDGSFEKLMESRNDEIQRGLDDAVSSIKRACEESLVGTRDARNSGYVI